MHSVMLDTIFKGSVFIETALKDSIFGGGGSPLLVPWTPFNRDTIAWLDAKKTDTITEVANLTSRIADVKGNGVDLIQVIGSSQLSTNLETINGNNVLSSTTDGRYMAGAEFTMPSSGNATVEILCQVDNTNGSNNDSILSWQILGGSGSWQFEADNTSDFNGKLRYNDLPTGSSAISGGPYTGDIVIWSIVMDFDNSLITVYANGSSVGSSAYTTKMTGDHVLKLFTNRANTSSVTGKFGEMFANEDVSDAQRQISEGYLAWEWGQQANLPIGHPYKDAPPMVILPSGALPATLPITL